MTRALQLTIATCSSLLAILRAVQRHAAPSCSLVRAKGFVYPSRSVPFATGRVYGGRLWPALGRLLVRSSVEGLYLLVFPFPMHVLNVWQQLTQCTLLLLCLIASVFLNLYVNDIHAVLKILLPWSMEGYYLLIG
jgi:hypothetical protein